MLSNNQQKFAIYNYYIDCEDETSIENLICQGKYKQAKENLILLKINEPATIAYDLLSANIYLHLKEYGNAKDNFDSYVGFFTDEPKIIIDALIEVMVILYKQDEYSLAIDFCEIGIKYIDDDVFFNVLSKIDIRINEKVIKFLNLYKIVSYLDYGGFILSDYVVINSLFEKIINENITERI